MCTGDDGTAGVCYTEAQCTSTGGSANGNCAMGCGVCCRGNVVVVAPADSKKKQKARSKRKKSAIEKIKKKREKKKLKEIKIAENLAKLSLEDPLPELLQETRVKRQTTERPSISGSILGSNRY